MANTLGLDPGIVGSSPTSSAIYLKLRAPPVAETRKRKYWQGENLSLSSHLEYRPGQIDSLERQHLYGTVAYLGNAPNYCRSN